MSSPLTKPRPHGTSPSRHRRGHLLVVYNVAATVCADQDDLVTNGGSSVAPSAAPSAAPSVVSSGGVSGRARQQEAHDEVVDVAVAVAAAAGRLGYEVEHLRLTDSLTPLEDRLLNDAAIAVDVVFNLVESLGDDAAAEPTVPALLRRLGVAFSGNAAAPLEKALAKDQVRAALAAAGVPVAPAVVVDVGAGDDEIAAAVDVLTMPVFVKPARVDGSIGIDQGSVVADVAAIVARVRLLHQSVGGAVLVEEYLPGPEVNVARCPRLTSEQTGDDGAIASTVAGHVWAPTVLDFSGFTEGMWPVVTYEAKWVEGSPDYQCRSVAVDERLPSGDVQAIIAIAQEALDAVGADGYARVDLRLDRHGRPAVIDVNPNPALHPEAGLVLALETVGLGFDDVVDAIVQHALHRDDP